MALRVLLADESSTIKKVFQLALQDYGVEVLSVNVGLDVVAVAQKFSPDIVFADVLLQKKNGYEVSAELKAHAELSQIPVVLVWSGFLELDKDKFSASKADSHLEKPFDAKKLRDIVQKLVPKTKTQNLSEFLSFPTLPEFEEGPTAKEGPAEPVLQVTSPPPQPAGDLEVHNGEEAKEDSWSMDNFDPIDSFEELPLPKAPPEEASAPEVVSLDEDNEEGESDWMQKSLSNYRLDEEQTQENTQEKLEVDYNVPEEPIEGQDFLFNSGEHQIAPEVINKPEDTEEPETDLELDLSPAQKEVTQTETNIPQQQLLSADELEAIIRSQAKDVLETVVWRVVPEMATQIIERELNRLLKERESKS